MSIVIKHVFLTTGSYIKCEAWTLLWKSLFKILKSNRERVKYEEKSRVMQFYSCIVYLFYVRTYIWTLDQRVSPRLHWCSILSLVVFSWVRALNWAWELLGSHKRNHKVGRLDMTISKVFVESFSWEHVDWAWKLLGSCKEDTRLVGLAYPYPNVFVETFSWEHVSWA